MVTFVTGNTPSGYEENIQSPDFGDQTGTTLNLMGNQTGFPIKVTSSGGATLRYSSSIGGIGGTEIDDQITANTTVTFTPTTPFGWQQFIINPYFNYTIDPGAGQMVLAANTNVGGYFSSGLVSLDVGQNFYTISAEGQEMIASFSIQLRRRAKLGVPRVVHIKRLTPSATFLVSV